MFGLGKKTTQPETPQPTVPVVTIPTEFYAGANPTITFKQVEKVITPGESPKPAPMPPADKKAFDKATALGVNQPLHPANVFGNRKKLIFIGGGLFSVFIVAAGGYYWLTAKKPTPPPPAPAKVVTPKPAPVVVPTTTEITPPPPPDTTIPKITDGRLEFPSMLLSKAADLDNDGLSDSEESVFKSDPGIPDSDSDGYLDGSEVFHLYNPVGKEPIKLIESGSVLDYVNPTENYAVYYPGDWQIGNVSGDNRDVLFSAISGDHIEIRAFEKNAQQTFADWLAENAPSEKFADLIQGVSRFSEPNYKRSDELVYYYVTTNKVFAIVYHAVDGAPVGYPGVLEMMARSFRSDASKEAIVPLPPTASETDGLPDTTAL